MNNNEYINNLQNCLMQKYNVEGWNNKFLSVEGADRLRDLNAFKLLLEDLEDNEYILDKENVLKIWDKIETVKYINGGSYVVDGWKSNHHIFVINNLTFEYQTGTGINCQKTKSYCYNIYKLLFDCISCLFNDANLTLELPLDDFLKELGYDENLKSIRKGENIYYQIKKDTENLLKIFSVDDIKNFREYVEL